MWRKVLLILVPLVILAIALTGAHILVERLFILTMIVLVFSYLVAFLGTRGIKSHLKVPGQRYQAGKSFPIEATVENTSVWPKPFLKLKIKSAEKLSEKDVMVNIPSRGVYSWQYELSLPQRGLYHLGPLVGEGMDVFGLFGVKRELDCAKEMLIYPPTVELPLFRIKSQSEPGLLHSEWISDETTGAISGVREYVPGDSLNRIHWRSTAHLGKLVVKEFDIDLSEKIWIILDLNKESHCGSGLESTEEYGVIIAASIVKKYIDSGLHVGLVAQGDKYYFYPARQGELHMWRIMEALAVCKAKGRIPLQRVLTGAGQQMSGNSVAIVITCGAQQEVAGSIISLKKQGFQVAAVLLDGSTFGGNGLIRETEKRLRASNVPLYVINKGDNLTDSLSGKESGVKTAEGRDVAGVGLLNHTGESRYPE